MFLRLPCAGLFQIAYEYRWGAVYECEMVRSSFINNIQKRLSCQGIRRRRRRRRKEMM